VDKNKYDALRVKQRKSTADNESKHFLLQIPIPPSTDIIGYITTGQYSFSQGHGFAIGCCSALAVLNILNSQMSEQKSAKTYYVLLRKTTSRFCQPATMELLM